MSATKLRTGRLYAVQCPNCGSEMLARAEKNKFGRVELALDERHTCDHLEEWSAHPPTPPRGDG